LGNHKYLNLDFSFIAHWLYESTLTIIWFTRLCYDSESHIYTNMQSNIRSQESERQILSFNPFLRGQASQKVKMILGKRSYSCFEGNSAGITPLHALWLAVSDNTTMVYFHSWHWTWRFCCGVHVNEWY